MKRQVIIIFTVLIVLALSSSSVVTAYSNFSVVFTDAINGTTRWISPIKEDGSLDDPIITSKWNEARSIGTSPHVGVDIGVDEDYRIVAVAPGKWEKVTDDSKYNTYSLDTDVTGLYCHYEHMSYAVGPQDDVKLGQYLGIPGKYAPANENINVHLHFGAYNKNKMSGRLAYRNETLYRDNSDWGNGRYLDTFSKVEWGSGSIARVTISFSGAGNGHTEKPSSVKIYYREEGDLAWIGPYNMTNSNAYQYTYDFSGKVPEGTTVQWLVQYKRASSNIAMYCPAKFYKPGDNPNVSGYSWAYKTNTVT